MAPEIRDLFKEEKWMVERTARIDELVMDNGTIRFRVQISDEGRPPFISRWFNDPVPASDFVERMRGGRFDPREDKL